MKHRFNVSFSPAKMIAAVAVAGLLFLFAGTVTAQDHQLNLVMEKCAEYSRYKDSPDYRYLPGTVMLVANSDLPREEIFRIVGSNGMTVKNIIPYSRVQMVVVNVPPGEEILWADRLASYSTIKCAFLNTVSVPATQPAEAPHQE